MFTAIIGVIGSGLKLAQSQKQKNELQKQYLFNTKQNNNNNLLYIFGGIAIIGIIILIVKYK